MSWWSTRGWRTPIGSSSRARRICKPSYPSSLTRWRKRLGEEGVETLLLVTIDAARRGCMLKASSLDKIIVDTTVMPKAIAHPTDKLSFQKLLMGIAMFISSANGCSALRLQRDLDVQAKTAFVFSHKLREAIQLIHHIPMMSGVVELDGGHFGGRPRHNRVRRRPTNAAIANRIQEQLKAQNESRKSPKAGRT